MVLFLTSADASAANGGGASMLVMMIVLIAVFYFFMIRPENKRKKEAQAMRDAIKVGDNITTLCLSRTTPSSSRPALTASVLSLRSLRFPPTTPQKRKRQRREQKPPLPARKRRQRSKIKIPADHRREFFVLF